VKKTTVVNIRDSRYDVYIGRNSRFGNPFRIGIHGTREEVINKYRVYLLSSPTLLREIENLRGKTLGCFCYPMPCHGDVIAQILDEEEWL
jgi:hypothetical protein